MNARRLLPFLDLAGYSQACLRADVVAGLTNVFMAVPQAVAYAIIAGLPPSAGLYASAIPTIVGALFRSSHHVVAGPTNAVSLLVGASIAPHVGVDPTVMAVTLAVMVGVFQVVAGLIGLGAIVDYVSSPVVLGYVTGAAVLIAIGQLPNVTSTEVLASDVPGRVVQWASTLGDASQVAVAMALATIAAILALRWRAPRLPGPIIVLTLATIAGVLLNGGGLHLRTVADVHPVPVGLPPLTLPDLELARTIVGLAVAIAVLSVVEATSVARAIAARTGQRLDSMCEVTGQGLANLAAGFTGGYPVGGSLSRSALNESAGAKTRAAGIFAGAGMVVVLLFLGPLVDRTPVAALAGLLILVAWDLIDVERIRITCRSTYGDRLGFVVTMVSTWVLPLDQAIYLGVGVSVALFLRQARTLAVTEVHLGDDGHLHSRAPSGGGAVRILQIDGRLFFGVEGVLRTALADVLGDGEAQVIVLHLAASQGFDLTVARIFEEVHHQMESRGGHLVVSGVSDDTRTLMERLGTLRRLSPDNVFSMQEDWMASLITARDHAEGLVAGTTPED